MDSRIILSSAFLTAFIVLRWLNDSQSRRRRLQQEREFQCQPVVTLSRRWWCFGLDVVKDMFNDYRSGTRNSRLHEQFKVLGSTFRTQPSGRARIFTIDVENVKAVFGGSIDEWGVEPIRLEAFKPAFGAGVLVTDGTRWLQSRKPCQLVIDKVYRDRVSNLSQLDAKIEELINLIPQDGTTVDLQPLFFLYMIDSSTEYIFGASVNSLIPGPAGSAGKKFLAATIHGLEASGERGEVPQWTHLVLESRLKESCALIREVADHHVHAVLDQISSSGDSKPPKASLAYEWVKLSKNPEEIRSQLLNVLIAAFDTTAVTLANAFFHLARNPRCYEALRDEVSRCKQDLSLEDLKSLRYLQSVLRETLRLNSPATTNSRMALCDTKMPRGGGPDGASPVFISKGDIVVTSIYSVQRNCDIFGKDADAFRPERWEAVKPRHWDYLPFSAGPRVCPGQNLALAHAAYVLFYLVRCFGRLENRDPVQELVESYQVTTASRNGVKVALYAD